ncbi:hypothetical protein GQ600_17557 [Phytophthora cactorum]|nr:hypothetical protein GQ600_17557 [Phytophthora cactorum]
MKLLAKELGDQAEMPSSPASYLLTKSRRERLPQHQTRHHPLHLRGHHLRLLDLVLGPHSFEVKHIPPSLTCLCTDKQLASEFQLFFKEAGTALASETRPKYAGDTNVCASRLYLRFWDPNLHDVVPVFSWE